MHYNLKLKHSICFQLIRVIKGELFFCFHLPKSNRSRRDVRTIFILSFKDMDADERQQIYTHAVRFMPSRENLNETNALFDQTILILFAYCMVCHI